MQDISPASQKQAVIRPCLKKPGLDSTDSANYPRISNLSFISKLIKCVVHRQLSTFVETNQLLPQSGFRCFHSTETTVLQIYNNIVTALDTGLITALFLLDFSATFDCVDFSILLQVLEVQFGLTDSSLNWIASFQTGRTHSVHVGTKVPKQAKLYNILFGVPQDSILGPLLLILYTSNITNIASRHGILIYLYADDTQLYIKLSTSDIENAKTKLANCFPEIQSWCSSMHLKLNNSKTELIWFTRRTKNKNYIAVQIDKDCCIQPYDVLRDLGSSSTHCQ